MGAITLTRDYEQSVNQRVAAFYGRRYRKQSGNHASEGTRHNGLKPHRPVVQTGSHPLTMSSQLLLHDSTTPLTIASVLLLRRYSLERNSIQQTYSSGLSAAQYIAATGSTPRATYVAGTAEIRQNTFGERDTYERCTAS